MRRPTVALDPDDRALGRSLCGSPFTVDELVRHRRATDADRASDTSAGVDEARARC